MTSRGDGQDDIYLDDTDRRNYFAVLDAVCSRFNWEVHAYCLMDNHYHLLVETPDGNLSQGMRQLNGVYTQQFNLHHYRVGHVYQGRYKAIIIEKETHLLELARYIVLNPVRAEMVRSVRDWPWSSYRMTVGQVEAPSWLNTEWILSAFAKRKRAAQEKYKAFVLAGKRQPSPWEGLKNQIYLGSDDFIEDVQRTITADQDLGEIPRAQRRQVAKALDYYEEKHKDRDVAISQAYASGGYSMAEVGNHFGLHYSRVSRIIKQQDKAKSKT